MGSVRVFLAATCCVVLAACSSSTKSAGPPSSIASSPTSIASSDSSVAANGYVSSVNKLCDALLPKVLAVIHGGHPDVYPVAEFNAELPAHSKLEADFDRQLAQLPVPAAANAQHAALLAYIGFANRIDAKRLAAAKQGQAAFDTEIRAENATGQDDPTITARDAAGFNQSCNAR